MLLEGKNNMLNVRKTDILVIGGGGAGIKAAIVAAEKGKSVLLLSKGPLSKTGTTPAAGEGMEAAVNPEDSVAMHYNDTIKSGRGLADEDLVWALAEDAIDRIYELEKYGAKFKKKDDGTFATSVRPGQSHPRNLFINGGGWGLAASLFKRLKELPNIQIVDSAVITRFLVKNDQVIGTLYLNVNNGDIEAVQAKATILSTGGYEQLWPFTAAPPDATGETLAMVYRIGAQLVDLEMVLYYPGVIIYPPAARGWLIQYEYFLNPDILDGRVVNGNGEEFVKGFPARDEFIRAIRQEVQKGSASPHGGFFIDLSHSRYSPEILTKKMLNWLHQYSNLKNVGIDLRTDKVELAPAVHYCLGGIKIDNCGRTSKKGLFAAGEIAGNVHGANRISGNALSETQVFGRRAALNACQYADKIDVNTESFDEEILEEYRQISKWQQKKEAGIRPIALKKELQKVMDQYVGLERNEMNLNVGLERIVKLRYKLSNLEVISQKRYCYELREAYEVRGMIDLAELVILSALRRKETRGHHFRTDYSHTERTPSHTSIYLSNGENHIGILPVTKR